MIIGRDIHPEKKVYHTGALIIQVLKDNQDNSFGYFQLYTQLKEQYKMSINTFTLSLDWLYLLGVVKHNHGKVEKCF